MTIRAFKDDKDGYYQVVLEDGEELPEWTKGLTECEVQPRLEGDPAAPTN